LSAFGGDVPAFTPLSISDFGEGWLTPWIPPPNGELHLQRGGWVGADSAFFSREFDPAFTFNAGTAGTRDEFIGAATLFVPLNRRLQIGLTVPFLDSLQSTNGKFRVGLFDVPHKFAVVVNEVIARKHCDPSGGI
jgi:hypothetical protein